MVLDIAVKPGAASAERASRRQWHAERRTMRTRLRGGRKTHFWGNLVMDMSAQANRTSRRDGFYGWVAIGTLLIVFIGFARTYFLKGVFGTSALSILLHAHAVLVTLWFVLFLIQTRLVAMRRIDLHRRLGVVAAVIATLVVLFGTAVAFSASKRGFLQNPASVRDIRGFAILCGFLVDFSVFVGAALYYRRRPEIHKRLMLLACCSILAPAIGRVPVTLISSGGDWPTFILLDLFVLICISYDTIKNRKLHRAFGWGGLLLVATFPSTLLIAQSNGWLRFARWLFT